MKTPRFARRSLRTTLAILPLALVAMVAGPGTTTASAADICYSQSSTNQQVSTSSRKSYVGLQMCYRTSSTGIQPFVKWTNLRGSLGCYISWPGGCSIDAWRPHVDFNGGGWVKIYVSGARTGTYSASLPTSSINASGDYTYTVFGPKYSTRGTYRIKAATEFDVKDDGRGWSHLDSGTAARTY